jgi:hypothetical protein
MRVLAHSQVERRKVAGLQLGERARGPFVPRDHHTRAMTGAVADPRFAPTVRKTDRNERSAQIVDAHSLSRFGCGEQLGALLVQSERHEVVAQRGWQSQCAGRAEGHAARVEKYAVVRARARPQLHSELREGPCNAGL